MTLGLEALPWFVLDDINTTEWIFPRHGNVFRRQERLLGNSLALWDPLWDVRNPAASLICIYSDMTKSQYCFSLLPLSDRNVRKSGKHPKIPGLIMDTV